MADVSVSLKNINKRAEFLGRKTKETLADISNRTIIHMEDKWDSGLAGDGTPLPKLSPAYRRIKQLAGVNGIRNFTGAGRNKGKGSQTGMRKSFRAKRAKEKDVSFELSFTGADQLKKARANQEILDRKGGMKFVSVSDRWVQKMQRLFFLRMTKG